MTDHDHGQAYKEQHVRATLEFFKRRVHEYFFLRKMSPDSIYQGVDILVIRFPLTANLILKDRIPFGRHDRVHDVLFKSMAQLSLVNGGRIVCVKIIVDGLLVYSQKNIYFLR